MSDRKQRRGEVVLYVPRHRGKPRFVERVTSKPKHRRCTVQP